jgi:alkylation response protein AidB-like acyl-CoA dehydrogenase
VVVPDEYVVEPFLGQGARPHTFGTYAQLLHAAIELGIARGALDDGVAFVRDRARPWPDAGVDRPSDEPHLQLHYGRLTTLVDAAEAFLLHSADALDATLVDDSDATITAARLEVAKAKAFVGEVANDVTTAIFEGAGSSGVDTRHGLDRHWRNARTHTLHDPNRWKYVHVGNWVLNDVSPAASNHVI